MYQTRAKRRALPEEMHHGDVLEHLIQYMKVESFVTEDFVVQLMFGLFFVSFDSLSSTLTLVFKLLAENPTVMEESDASIIYVGVGDENSKWTPLKEPSLHTR